MPRKMDKLELGFQVVHLKREIIRIQLSAEQRLEALVEAPGAVDDDLEAGPHRRQEEGEALDVVPVGVGDEQMQLARLAGRQRDAEVANARAGVEDDDFAAVLEGHT